MHDCDKNNPSVILANFYHKSFTFRKNAAFYGSKDLEGAVRATVFSPEMENNIKHRLPSETFIFIVWVVGYLPNYTGYQRSWSS